MKRKNSAFIQEQLTLMFPEAQCELVHGSPFQLLIAVILSAQTTDQSVNKVTPQLFAHYPTPEALAHTSIEAVEECIKTLGLYHSKAKHIIAASQQLVERFHGEVPGTREELMSLPGVGRKTANVVLSVVFHVPALAVDTHVERVSKRLGYCRDFDSPLEVESILTRAFPRQSWNQLHHQLIFLGRYQCHARQPQCTTCKLQSVCDYYRKLTK